MYIFFLKNRIKIIDIYVILISLKTVLLRKLLLKRKLSSANKFNFEFTDQNELSLKDASANISGGLLY